MTTRGSDEEPKRRTFDEAPRQDWQRYGLSHQPAGDEPTPEVAVNPIRPEDRHALPEEDLFVEYRYENGGVKAKAERPPSPRRFSTNLAAIGVVGVVGGLIAIVAIVTSSAMPAPSPTPGITSPVLGHGPSNSGTIAIATSEAAHVGLLIPLPSKFLAVDHGQSLDDGAILYLTNADGGVAIDTATGTVKTVFGGAAFANGSNRAAVDNGLWVSNWPDSGSICGPSCWAGATTFRIDPATGSITRNLTGTYLIASDTDGVWVATGKKVERLDPASGNVISSTPWTGSGEPRVGCNALWSIETGSGGPVLSKIDRQSGNAVGGTTLSPELTYGPITVEGQCWMMNGQGGAEVGSASLAQLKTDGSIETVFEYPNDAISIIDGEFWLYMPNGLIRRFDANSGSGYGTPFVLPVRPADDNPKWFFAAVGALWLIQDNRLTGFDVPTGSSRVNG